MKKIITLLVGVLFIPCLYAKETTWSDIDISCFSSYIKIDTPITGANKLKIDLKNSLFFVQDQKILPAKIFTSAKENYLDYKILKITALAADSKDKNNLLFDGNLKTSLSFDPYNPEPKEINLDAQKILTANSYNFKLHYSGNTKTIYFVSEDNLNFIEVANPEQFAWRYLKIQFQPINKNTTTVEPIQIQEISLATTGESVYLFQAVSQNPVEIYANYECKSEIYYQLLQQADKITRLANFSIDANTKEIQASWEKNSMYNEDFDQDGKNNAVDNCPFGSNVDQSDIDGDLIGNACDFDNTSKNYAETDNDNDGVGDAMDNCPYIYNPLQTDTNADKTGDLCTDDDQDGIIGSKDNCVNVSNVDQKDVNINGIGDACEFDKDEDLIFDSLDNCITVKNVDQKDSDNDGIGDICDNCEFYNPSQVDKDNNKIGDVCDDKKKKLFANDEDQDGILNNLDNCPKFSNADQQDSDKDGIGDVCDNCLHLNNPKQEDEDKNKIGDLCEDSDKDGLDGYLDNCMNYANADQKDTDNDGIGDKCEDDDFDNLVMAKDNCPFDYNPDQWDNDKDGIGDKCDKKDDRFIESNKWVVIGGIVLVTLIFIFMIITMIKKLGGK